VRIGDPGHGQLVGVSEVGGAVVVWVLVLVGTVDVVVVGGVVVVVVDVVDSGVVSAADEVAVSVTVPGEFTGACVAVVAVVVDVVVGASVDELPENRLTSP